MKALLTLGALLALINSAQACELSAIESIGPGLGYELVMMVGGRTLIVREGDAPIAATWQEGDTVIVCRQFVRRGYDIVGVYDK